MKNIYVLPTDKPSRLSFDFDEEKYLLTDDLVLFDNQNLLENRNIYITSDEEIKEGDFVYDFITETVYQLFENPTKNEYKIILTTDPDLISYCVSPIDDEFLQWFVQNSSCDFVETKNMLQTKWGIDWHDLPNQDEGREPDGIYRKIYKTILPSNEITPDQLFNDDKRELVKKAILEHKNSNTSPEEELLNNIKYVLSVGNDSQEIRLIEQYGHWKQEGLFSEEDVNEIIAETWNSCEDNEGETYTQARERIINTHKNK